MEELESFFKYALEKLKDASLDITSAFEHIHSLLAKQEKLFKKSGMDSEKLKDIRRSNSNLQGTIIDLKTSSTMIMKNVYTLQRKFEEWKRNIKSISDYYNNINSMLKSIAEYRNQNIQADNLSIQNHLFDPNDIPQPFGD